VYADVASGGEIAVGDEVRVVAPPEPTAVGLAVNRVRAGLRRGVTRASEVAMPRGRR
jgi:hypothetical protein